MSESVYPFRIAGLKRGRRVFLAALGWFASGDEPTEEQRAAIEAQGLKLEASTPEQERAELPDEARQSLDRLAQLESAYSFHDREAARIRQGLS